MHLVAHNVIGWPKSSTVVKKAKSAMRSNTAAYPLKTVILLLALTAIGYITLTGGSTPEPDVSPAVQAKADVSVLPGVMFEYYPGAFMNTGALAEQPIDQF